MKAENLKILRQNKFNVPPFITVTSSKNIDLSFSRSKLFAVRSSFGGEDGSKHSFAGQYKTLLNVKKADVTAAVDEVLSSLNNAAAYADAKGISAKSGCVIIQDMISADISGVLFTANPKGILNETVVTAGKGTGDNVVNDSGETSAYFYNLDDKVWYRENGQDILTHDILSELLQNADKAKKIFGKYLDIEFAVKDKTLYILQVRPITSLSPKRLIVLDSSNISESYPGITLPLTQSFVRDIYTRIFEGCLMRMSGDKRLVRSMRPQLKNMVKSVNGREYYVISSWYAILSLLPFSNKIIPVWRQMLGIEDDTFDIPKIKTSLTQKTKIFISFIYYLFSAPGEMRLLKNRFDKNYILYQNMSKKQDIPALLNAFDSISADILSNWDITLINDMYAFIFTYLCKNKNIKNISPESLKPVKALNRLIMTYRKYGIESREYKTEKRKYISLYGDRISGELKLETPTYRTEPSMLDDYVNAHSPAKIPKAEKRRRNYFERCAATGIAGRESSRLDRSRIFGLIRGIMLNIGGILVKNGLISSREDVFYLYLHELRNIENFDAGRLKSVIAQRKQRFENLKDIPYFKRLVFADKITEKSTACSAVSNDGKILYGNGVSGGKVRGEILIVDDPTKADAREKIIVTRSTDPGWVFLIQNCRGIVAERGSLLSHTAIISRELEKPSLVNVKNASQILKNGMLAELDADRGRIVIL